MIVVYCMIRKAAFLCGLLMLDVDWLLSFKKKEVPHEKEAALAKTDLCLPVVS